MEVDQQQSDTCPLRLIENQMRRSIQDHRWGFRCEWREAPEESRPETTSRAGKQTVSGKALCCVVQRCNGVGDVLLAHLSVAINHYFITTADLSVVADYMNPFMATIYHLLMAKSSMIMNRVSEQTSSQAGFREITETPVYFGGLSTHW